MSDALHQISMKYIKEQDRILFRLGTTKNTEYQMWFTRRLVNTLWDSLHSHLSEDAEIDAVEDLTSPSSKDNSFNHQALVDVKKASDKLTTLNQKAKTLTGEAREALLGMQHQEAIQKTNFKKAHKKDNTILTAKTGPLLIASGTVSSEKGGIAKINLIAVGGAKLQFGLSKKLLHAFCQLLISSTKKANWNLGLSVGDGNIAPSFDGQKNLH